MISNNYINRLSSITRAPSRLLVLSLHAVRASAASTQKPNPPAGSDADASPLAPFWQEFRRQVGRLEGLEAVPVPPDLRLTTCTSPPVTARSGAFHADRIRYGRFLFMTVGDKAILLGALFPTLYSPHPPMVFEIAYLAAHGWIVSFDFLPLSSTDPVLGDLPGGHEAKVLSQLELIKQKYMHIAVKFREEGPVQRLSLPGTACVLSSAEAAALRARAGVDKRGKRTIQRSKEANLKELHGLPLQAFKLALSTHLDYLVMAPLDGAASSVATTAAAHAAIAERLSSQAHFLGADALEAAFGYSYLARLRALVLDDRYGLLRKKKERQQIHTSQGISSAEFIYFDPRELNME